MSDYKEAPSIFIKHNVVIHSGENGSPTIKIVLSRRLPKPDFDIELNNIVSKYKMLIESSDYSKYWDKAKKISNDFELIHVSKSKYSKISGISRYNPLSRSYFKLLEIITDFNLIDSKKEVYSSAHIAEGPGGFIEAFIHKRKSNPKDKIYAITLKSETKEIPGWNKAKFFLSKHKNIKVSYGKDGTGNIYNIDNIKHFSTIGVESNKIDFITADGGFDFSIDFNKQELLSYRLLFCQIVIALSTQKIGGCFVCKFFDVFHLSTVKLIWLLHCFYKTVYISKPFTSRPANSEKYIIAKNFIGIPPNYLNKLYEIVQLWDILNDTNFYITDIFDISLSKKFLSVINEYNYHIVKRQTESIIKTLLLSKKMIPNYLLKNIRKQQFYNAKKWCVEYKILHYSRF